MKWFLFNVIVLTTTLCFSQQKEASDHKESIFSIQKLTLQALDGESYQIRIYTKQGDSCSDIQVLNSKDQEVASLRINMNDKDFKDFFHGKKVLEGENDEGIFFATASLKDGKIVGKYYYWDVSDLSDIINPKPFGGIYEYMNYVDFPGCIGCTYRGQGWRAQMAAASAGPKNPAYYRKVKQEEREKRAKEAEENSVDLENYGECPTDSNNPDTGESPANGEEDGGGEE